MKELIATLSVYKIQGQNLPSRVTRTAPTSWELEYHPDTDSQMLNKMKVKLVGNEFESVIAHELGHFVAELAGEKEQSVTSRLADGDTPSEERAWNIASGIFPNLNTDLREKALKGYRDTNEAGKNDLMIQLLMQMYGQPEVR